jgi:chromosome segregation protein
LRNDLNNKKIEQNKAIQNVQSKDGELKRIELQEQESTLKIDNLTERAKEETGNILAEAYQTYTDDPNMNWEEIGKQIQDMRDKLGTMNDVNLSAIDQLKELEERLALYDVQEQDLVKSKHSLQELIRKMNRESREKFQLIFNQIQENFNTVFRKLFGGGKAELILCKVKETHPEAPVAIDTQTEQASGTESAMAETAPVETAEAEVISSDSLDVLEAGVEIIAKPPGKEPTSISLLSGGEKTLTAFALTMAIFQLHPSPFCILDEADAALDESNVNRFIALLRDYTSHTQFIIISHNKKTMVTMDRLYGLTLQKSGISKKISVKMADEQTEVKPELVGAAS